MYKSDWIPMPPFILSVLVPLKKDPLLVVLLAVVVGVGKRVLVEFPV